MLPIVILAQQFRVVSQAFLPTSEPACVPTPTRLTPIELIHFLPRFFFGFIPKDNAHA